MKSYYILEKSLKQNTVPKSEVDKIVNELRAGFDSVEIILKAGILNQKKTYIATYNIDTLHVRRVKSHPSEILPHKMGFGGGNTLKLEKLLGPACRSYNDYTLPFSINNDISGGNKVPEELFNHLQRNFNILSVQMRQMPLSQFNDAQNVPGYSDMFQNGDRVGFFWFSANGFINVNRIGIPVSRGELDGNKFHISVQRELMPQAYQALSGLLFSEDSPFNNWKMTDVRIAHPQERLAVGAQFTLYVENLKHSALSLHMIRQFIQSLQTRLLKNRIIPGRFPESDVHPENWRYVSYRDERNSDRVGSAEQSQRLRQLPFYRLMTD